MKEQTKEIFNIRLGQVHHLSSLLAGEEALFCAELKGSVHEDRFYRNARRRRGCAI